MFESLSDRLGSIFEGLRCPSAKALTTGMCREDFGLAGWEVSHV